MNGNATQYTITPMVPGVRPQDDPDYDGITFVYVFTEVLDPWVQPAANQNVVLVVANAQGFVAGMTVVIENAGYYEVVSTDALSRMTVMNFGTNYNVPPGTGIAPGKVTTTSLPGPPGGDGADGAPGPPGLPGAPGPPLNAMGTVATVGDLPPSGNTIGDLWTVASTGHAYAWNGSAWIDMGQWEGPIGPQGIQGASGPQGSQGPSGPQGSQGPSGPQGSQGPSGPQGSQGPSGPQGVPGPSGPTAISANANNKAILGTDSLILVQGTASGIAASTHAQTVSGDDPQLTNARVPLVHGSTHVTGTDPIPVATSTSSGSVPATPNNAAQFLAGGATAAFSALPCLGALTASFTCPAFYGTVAGVAISSSPWLKIGDKIYVIGAGKFFVVAKASNTSVTLLNSGDLGNASSGTIASGTNWQVIPAEPGESISQGFSDDFLDGTSAGFHYYANQIGTGAAATGYVNNWSEPDHRGIAFITGGTTNACWAWITGSQSMLLQAGGTLAWRAVLYPGTKPTTTTTALANFWIGLGTQASSGTLPTDFVGFTFQPSVDATNWRFTTRKGGTETDTVTGFAYTAAAWVDMSFIVDANGARWRIFTQNSAFPAPSAAVTANLPLTTTDLALLFAIYGGAACTTSYTNYIDLWEMPALQPTPAIRFRGLNLINNF